MRFPRIVLIATVLLLGCSSVPMPPGLRPYKIDVQQGNVITQEMVAKLKPGMTKAQVRFALGTPMITDAFHADRWDYVYQYQKGGRIVEQRKVTAVFEDDKLKALEGDVVPGVSTPEQPPAKQGEATQVKPEQAQEDKPKEEKGFFGRMLEKIGL